MKDLLVLIIMGSVFYITYCIAAKKPIIPTKKNLEKAKEKKRAAQKHATETHHANLLDEVEPLLMDDLFDSVVDIRDGMLVLNDDWYTKIVEVTPVNYYLKDLDEQEQIDKQIEVWTTTLDHTLPRIYYQNRFIDLTENMKSIKDTFEKQTDLPPAAIEYGRYMLEDLENFQTGRPRYETKIYLIFDYQVKKSELHVESDESIQEVAFKKAFSELDRQIARSEQLTKSGVMLRKLDNSGITELHYHLFQRRRARKLRFNDIQNAEPFAQYVTAEQTPEHIAEVKEMIDFGTVKEKNSESYSA